MRMLMHVKLPPREFNAIAKNGSISQTMKRILEDAKPEAVYFTEYEGRRGLIMIVDVPEPSAVPRLAEPWFLLFNADVSFHIVMAPAELEKAGCDKLASKWQ
ncbi:MAG: hypothetical protein LLF76_11025 [Planctomycetaceae bacterium]|nr:hypothetical protein [Planctomycetaceae bacterium]